MRRYDSAAEETVRERRAAIESGRLKGRRLFDVPGSGDGEAEICSGLSGVTDDDDDDEEEDECCRKIKTSEEVVAVADGGNSASSSSSSSSLGIRETEKKRKTVRGLMPGGRWIGMVSVLLVVVIVAMRTCASGRGTDGSMNLVPT